MAKVLLLIILIFVPVSSVFSAVPEIDLSVGFSDRFCSGTITPVSVFISSPDAALNADLVLEFIAGTALKEGDSYTFHRAVRLAPGVPGVFRFSLPLEVSSYPLSARIEQNGLVLSEVEKELRPLNVDRPLVVGLSRRPSLDFLIPILGDRFQRRVELVYPRAEFLPSSSEAWEGVGLVLWHDLSPGAVDSAAMTALETWIEGGGEMIVIGGPWLSGRPFPESLPPGAVSSPVQADGEAVYLPKEIPFGSVKDHLFLYSRGKGRILYIPRDMVSPTIAVKERRDFWIRTFEKLVLRETNDSEELETFVSEAWFQDDRSLLEPVRFPLILAGLFFCSAGCLLFAGRRIERSGTRLLQLFSILLLSAGTSAVALLRFSTWREDSAIPPRSLTLLVAGNYGSSRLISRVRFVSPGEHEFDWLLPPSGIPVLSRGGDLLVAYEDEGPVLKGLRVRPWEELEVIYTADLPGFGTGGSQNSVNIQGSGKIRHNGDQTWFDVVLLVPGGVSPLAGEWAPGEILSISEAAPGESPDEAPGSGIFSPGIGFKSDYSRMVRNLISSGEDFQPFVLARDSKNMIILHPGTAP